MDEELKPCPFCGSKAAQQNYVVEAVVHCTSCFVVIRRTHAPTVDTGIAASAEAWNARAAITPPEGYADAVRDAARYRYIRGVAAGEPTAFGQIEDAAFAAHYGDPAQFDFNIDEQMASCPEVSP